MRGRGWLGFLAGLLVAASGVAGAKAAAPEPRVIEVVCTREGARVVRGVGDARSQGVTVRFRHPGGHWSFFYDGAPNNWTSLGSAMVAELQLPIPPGPVRLQCLPSDDDDASTHDPRWWVDARAEDPRGLWRSPELDCAQAVGSSWHGASRPADQEREAVQEAFARAFPPVEGDRIVRVGYPRQQPRIWGLYREGALISTLRMMPPGRDGSVTPNLMTSCARQAGPAQPSTS